MFIRLIIFFSFLFPLTLHAQPLLPEYTITHIPLPPEMDKQVCISGINFLDGKLYFASERCPLIICGDTKGTVLNKIITDPGQEFEMEGITSYRQKLYTVSENIAAIYEIDPATGLTKPVSLSKALPAKSKSGDGMEGIAGNKTHEKFYLLRERNEDMTRAQIFTYTIEPVAGNISLRYESMIELPLDNPQWRYSDICYDSGNNRLLCLKSFSKGKQRQQYIEAIDIDNNGQLLAGSLHNIAVENFSGISNVYKDQDYSMNLEGITVDAEGNIYVVSDNTSGRAACDRPAKEKTILLGLRKKTTDK